MELVQSHEGPSHASDYPVGPNCKKATLNINLFGSHAEYAAQCPVCGPVFGFVILGFRDGGTEPTDKLPEAQAS